MSPFDLNQLSAISIAERDQDHTVHPISTLANDASSLSCPIFFRNPHNDHGADGTGFHLQQQLLQQDPKDYTRMISGSSDHRVSCPTSHQDINNKIKLTWCKPYAEEGKLQAPGQWMSSKMRIMKKMLISEYRKPRGNTQITQEQNQTEQGFSTSNCSIKPPTGIIRVCSDCNTTKTPLWRGGPHGPKSLCNACGIRQRKARRAMEAAGVSVGIIHSDTPTKMRREKSDAHRTVAFKKRCKITTASASKKQLCLEDVKISPSTNFPQEERDAAILLMTLSCGLTWS